MKYIVKNGQNCRESPQLQVGRVSTWWFVETRHESCCPEVGGRVLSGAREPGEGAAGASVWARCPRGSVQTAH